MCDGVVIMIEYPSGCDRAVASVATVPPAPGRWSITTGLPRISVASAQTSRETKSTAPPGGNGRNTLIGRSG